MNTMTLNQRLGATRRWMLLGGVLFALLPFPGRAATVTDTFTNAANWEPFLFAGPEYNLVINNGRMNYTATITNVGGAAARRIANDLPGNTNVLFTTQDWSLEVDVHVNHLWPRRARHGRTP